ncbi:hypothetical protein SH203_03010 [Brevundimonas sp. SH203]|nr:hypothetical protein SH203_03010 [Brevundimonas sp. SH203]
MEVVARLAGRIADQHVGDPAALGARQPGGDEGVGGVDLRVGPHRTARQEDRDGRDARRLQAFQRLQRFGRQEVQRVHVALELGIGGLAEDDDGDVGLLGEGAVGAEGRLAAAGRDGLADAAPDRLAVGEVGVGVARALPRQGPAARGLADVVGVARDQHPRARPDRQDRAFVLQQHQRLAHRLARQGAVGGRAQFVHMALDRAAVIEQAGLDLDPQDAAHRLVQTRHRDLARLHLGQGRGVERLPAVGRHEHVDAGVEGQGAAFVRTARQLAVGVPVRHHEAVEAQRAAQHVGQDGLVARMLDPVPAGEAGHDRQHARVDGLGIAGQVGADHLLFGSGEVALVLAARGAAVG